MWADEVSTVALAGMFGCTAILAVSDRGMWILHLWEDPSFTGALLALPAYYPDPNNPGQYIYQEPIYEDEDDYEARFQRDVIGAMRRGNSLYHVYGLEDLRGGDPARYGNLFDDDADPRFVVITPRPMPSPGNQRPEIAGPTRQYRYRSQVVKIVNELYRMKPDANVIVVDYHPLTPPLSFPGRQDPEVVKSYMRDTRDASPQGKILIQYMPPASCNGQQAAYRVLFHHRTTRLPEKHWRPNMKRDNSSVCEVSTSATASSTSVPASSTSTQTTTSTTTSTTTTPTAQATAPTLPARCYNGLQRSCYNAVTPAAAYSKSENFCSDYTSRTIEPNGPEILYIINEFMNLVSYVWSVSWKPNCEGDEMNVGQPIAAFSCLDAMRLAFDGCNNGGHGGTVEVGCVAYDFNPVNQGDATGCSLPFS
ncbi:hypothetical protein GGR54DRAFT_627408 [Hypoxylon sp. NC1633]|nr:hypothetical protein GGR54DRAFT_627408 [Hypoxylon sp. NC1633]